MNPSKLIVTGIMFWSCLCAGQSVFITNQNGIFRQSETQWLSAEIERVNAPHFNCSSEQHHWTYPQGPTCTLFGKEIPVSDEERLAYKQLLFPGDDCRRYLKMLALCDLYFPLFRKKAESLGLHRDYQLLPLMLSGCNQNYSDKNDRCGLWALDYLTARRIHLRIDTLIDERRGGDFTTDAALGCIAEYSTRFHGDPFKTIYAYRNGMYEFNMTDTLRSGAEYVLSLDSSAQEFYKCMAYVAELVSATRTTNQLNTFFDIFGLSESVVFERKVSFEALYEILKADRQALRDVNPVYTGYYIEPGYRRVPFMLDKVVSLKFEALKDSVYNWRPQVTQTHQAEETEDEVITYKVKRGDSLGKIAGRYGVSIGQLKSWNKLRSDRISKGQVLKIHRTKKVKPTASAPEAPQAKPATLADSPEENAQKLVIHGDQCMKKKDFRCAVDAYEKAIAILPSDSSVQEKLQLAKKSAASKPAEKNKVYYTVKSGDSLWGIAHKYPGVTEQDIMKWNQCGEKIRPGQKLIIYPKKK